MYKKLNLHHQNVFFSKYSVDSVCLHILDESIFILSVPTPNPHVWQLEKTLEGKLEGKLLLLVICSICFP